MSSSAAPTPRPAEKKSSLSKLVTRMKTVLKKSKDSKRNSVVAPKSIAGPSTTTPIVPTPVIAEPVAEDPNGEIPVDPTKPVKVLRSTIDSERARKLAERFKVSLESIQPTLPIKAEAYRVEKKIRVRIHRTCHLCNTTFGSAKVCVKCEHVRCKYCPRYPLKKDGKAKAKIAPVVVPGAIEPDTYYSLNEKIVLTKPNPKTGGQPLVRKKTMQRVRRTCHCCSALFTPGSKTCASCQHIRCVDCPRDPAKKKRYPDGYPGDAPSSDPTRPIKYACHKCNKTFPAIPNPADPAYVEPETKLECVRCKHELCGVCHRALPVRVEPSPDPEVLKSLQAKLAALNLSSLGM